MVQTFLNERTYMLDGVTWFIAECKHCDYVVHDKLRDKYRCSLLTCELGDGRGIPEDCPLARRYKI